MGTTRTSKAKAQDTDATKRYATPAQRQFPSLSGDVEAEVAERSQDVEAPKADEHLKVYVVQRNPEGDDFDEDMHRRNIDAMRQSAILQGLRPTGDGRFVGAEDGDDDGSVRLTYALPVVPAVVDEPGALRYVVEADQHAADQAEAEAEAKGEPIAADPLYGRDTAGTDPQDNSTPEGSGGQA